MSIFYTSVEYLASLVEATLIISAITNISSKRYSSIKKHLCSVWLYSIIMTICVIVLNQVQIVAFSYMTVILAFIIAIFLTRFTSTGDLLLRSTACVLSFFILHTFDYIIGFSIALIVEKSPDVYYSFDAIMQPGITRTLFTIINKSLQTTVFFVLKPCYEKIRNLDKRNLIIILLISAVAYVVITILLTMIMSTSPVVMQMAIIISWIFILICIISIIVTFYMNTIYHKKQQEHELILTTNNIMERSYLQMSDSLANQHKQAHDYKNHLQTVYELAKDNWEVKKYIEELYESFNRSISLCHSGNDYIDAILNCKISDAKSRHIRLTYDIQLISPIMISSTDICAILANQLDNAIEACEKIASPQDRWIAVSIGQKQDFTFFKVENSILPNSLQYKDLQHSSKPKQQTMHGLGIKNIQSSVSRYAGTLTNKINERSFVSIAMVQS